MDARAEVISCVAPQDDGHASGLLREIERCRELRASVDHIDLAGADPGVGSSRRHRELVRAKEYVVNPISIEVAALDPDPSPLSLFAAEEEDHSIIRDEEVQRAAGIEQSPAAKHHEDSAAVVARQLAVGGNLVEILGSHEEVIDAVSIYVRGKELCTQKVSGSSPDQCQPGSRAGPPGPVELSFQPAIAGVDVDLASRAPGIKRSSIGEHGSADKIGSSIAVEIAKLQGKTDGASFGLAVEDRELALSVLVPNAPDVIIWNLRRQLQGKERHAESQQAAQQVVFGGISHWLLYFRISPNSNAAAGDLYSSSTRQKKNLTLC